MSRQRYVAHPLPHVAAIYTRVSTKGQAGDDRSSLQTQEANCRAKALADGYSLIAAEHVYTDQHSGEELHERPAMTRLRADAKAHTFAALYVHSVDRLARDPVHLSLVLDEMARAGVAVVFVSDPLDDSPEAGIVRYIQGYAGKLDNARRREASMRGRTARAARGKPIPGPRAPYGYVWADVRNADGARLRERYEKCPATQSVVDRIWGIALGVDPWTLRGIAGQLTRDGVRTATGRGTDWDPGVVRAILTTPIYWGQPTALTHVQVPVALSVRAQYAHKSRTTRRPAAQRIALPADTAPAYVTPAQAAFVAERLGVHQKASSRSHTHDPLDALLRGGIARCGYCGYSLYVARSNGYVSYRCHKLAIRAGGCTPASIAARKLDDAVWARICQVLSTPALIEDELAKMRALDAQGNAPGADVLADLDAQAAAIAKRIANKRAYIEYVTDADEQRQTAEEVTLLRQQQRAIEDERARAELHYAQWREDEAGLQRILDACARVAGHLEQFTRAQRRETLLALKACVRVWRVDHLPHRVDLTFRLRLSGVLALGAIAGLTPGSSTTQATVMSSSWS